MEHNTFDIIHHNDEGVNSLRLNGYLDAHTAPKLEHEINTLINDGKKFILVDFDDLDYISSAGLGVFMAFIEDIREKGGDIKMCSMKPKVYSVFDLLGFPVIFDIVKDEAAAYSKFKELINTNAQQQ